MIREEIRHAYEPVPASLDVRVQSTLRHLDDAPSGVKVRRLSVRTAALVAALVLGVGGAAYAVITHQSAAIFGWFYGGTWQADMEQGAYAPMGQTRQVGDVTYTVEEMVCKTTGELPGLYGVVRIAPAEGANVVLLPEDVSVDDPAGYLLHYGETGQELTDDAPSYAELAEQKGARLLTVRAAVQDVKVNGASYTGSVGTAWLPQEDGTVLGTIEITEDFPQAERYELTLHLSNGEMSAMGLQDDDTALQEDWTLDIVPQTEE